VRRGFERTLFRGTVVLAIIFTVIAVVAVRINE
jgi:preprotein translocase subunit SecG